MVLINVYPVRGTLEPNYRGPAALKWESLFLFSMVDVRFAFYTYEHHSAHVEGCPPCMHRAALDPFSILRGLFY